MRRKELSEKIDAELRLTRAAFDRNGQAFERNAQAFERMMVSFDRFERAFDENQVFMRDMHRRHEIVTQQMIQGHQEFMQKLNQSTEQASKESARKTDKILAELEGGREEWREELRAHREALFALIDRLPPPRTA